VLFHKPRGWCFLAAFSLRVALFLRGAVPDWAWVAAGALIDGHLVIALTGVLMRWADAPRVDRVLQQLSREEDL
jgi:hypothetical protein